MNLVVEDFCAAVCQDAFVQQIVESNDELTSAIDKLLRTNMHI